MDSTSQSKHSAPDISESQESGFPNLEEVCTTLPALPETADYGSFVHQPLESGYIRILHLEPGVYGSPLYATFQLLRLRDVEKAWGDFEDSQELSDDASDLKDEASELRSDESEPGNDESESGNEESEPDNEESEPDNEGSEPGEEESKPGEEDLDLLNDEPALGGEESRLGDHGPKSNNEDSELSDEESELGDEESEPDDSEPEVDKNTLRLEDNSLRYEAISYAWGPPVLSHHITIDKSCRLPITESLFLALQRFRLALDSRKQWADTVCINQNSNAEKSAQVARMGAIYHAAVRVLVWLGESEGSDWLTFALMAIPEILVDTADPDDVQKFITQYVPYDVNPSEKPLPVPGVDAPTEDRRAFVWVKKIEALERVAYDACLSVPTLRDYGFFKK
ncbi:hypothetical protein LTR36_004884 [Oleoguttula mirabilis]|uniref:Heterokaryon incompatibility domain-containing protein n=1 Tax=Oleoguttula mirabilis TaxID=1507867 RepID=A0AAV9JF73_9PEZI|nr:hypothetical protein LTR36_004884 [Oleoguttula mirabilis]